MKLSMLRELARRFAPPKNQEEMAEILAILKKEGYEIQSLYQELEMSSPMVETHRDESYTNASITLHSHTFYEVIYCRTCEGVEYLVGTNRYRLQQGDIVIVAPGVSHRPMLPDRMEVPYQRDIIWFSQEFAERMCEMQGKEYPQLSGSGLAFLRTQDTKWDYLGEMFRKGVKEAERGKRECEGVILGNTIMLLSLILRALGENGENQQEAETPELLEQIMAYIERNLSKKITLEEAAQHVYVSTSTVSQLFRQKMGTSFYHCVIQRRLIAAKTYIAQGERLEDVCHLVGFADYSSFYRAFKKEYGISPRQYRSLQESNENSRKNLEKTRDFH